MRIPCLLFAIAATSLPVPVDSAEPEAPPAIKFARKSFKSAESPLMRWSIKGDKVEGAGPLYRWSANTCPMASDESRFRVLPDALADYCRRNGGQMDLKGLAHVMEGRCWQTANGREATWFAFSLTINHCVASEVSTSTRYTLAVAELNPAAVGTPGSDMAWAEAGLKTDQQVLSERSRNATAIANTEAFLQQQEQARVAAEAPRLKTKGTQVCKRLPDNGGTFLGYVEDASGDRIKVLVTQHYWGEPGVMRDTSYRGQEYVWSNLSEWYLC